MRLEFHVLLPAWLPVYDDDDDDYDVYEKRDYDEKTTEMTHGILARFVGWR